MNGSCRFGSPIPPGWATLPGPSLEGAGTQPNSALPPSNSIVAPLGSIEWLERTVDHAGS
jgi:hypothetical protein